MGLSIDFDIFFNQRVADEMLNKLEEWVGFSFNLCEYKIVEYSSGKCSYFVKISSSSDMDSEIEIEQKFIEALWKIFKIPLIAYGCANNRHENCVRWAADRDGIRSVMV